MLSIGHLRKLYLVRNIAQHVPACMFIVYPEACTETHFGIALTSAGLTNFNPTISSTHFNWGSDTDASHLVNPGRTINASFFLSMQPCQRRRRLTNSNPIVGLTNFHLGENTDVYWISWPTHQCVFFVSVPGQWRRSLYPKACTVQFD